MNLITAIKRIVDMRIERSLRSKTKSSYQQWFGAFEQWVKMKNLHQEPLKAFTKAHAYEYVDFLILDKGLGATTVKNHKGFIAGCFQELVNREYVVKNPFSGIKNSRCIRKKRDAYTFEEAEYLLSKIREEDPMLFLFVLFVYGACIRPIEVTRLQYYMVDLEHGFINLPAEVTKTWTHGTPTLPKWIVKEMKIMGVHLRPKSHYIFGHRFESGIDGPCGHYTPQRRHKKYVDLGIKNGIIRESANLTLYSWKYTAGDELSSKLTPFELQQQMRHKRIETTMLYLTRKVGVIKGVRNHEPAYQCLKQEN